MKQRLKNSDAQLIYNITDIDKVIIHQLPDCGIPVKAGLPDAYLQDLHNKIDTKEILGLKDETVIYRASGDSMIGKGIYDDTILIGHRGQIPENGNIVIAWLNDGCTVKEYHKDPDTGTITLIPHNAAYHPIVVDPQRDYFVIQAIVTKTVNDI